MAIDGVAAIEEPLPRFYSGIVRKVLGSGPARESRATCNACAMVRQDGPCHERTAHPFRPDVKCCSYLPVLPNFLVGAALSGDDISEVGRSSITDRIAKRVAVTPLGLGRTPVYSSIYDSARGAFGRSGALRCIHFDESNGGGCGIWAHRNSVCATWFCKYERGAIGFEFWNATRQFLAIVESELSVWCCLQMQIPAPVVVQCRDNSRSPQSLLLEELIESNRARYESIWKDWAGREEEFYSRSYRLVSQLQWSEIEMLGGQDLQLSMTAMRVAYEACQNDKLPERLVLGVADSQRTSTGVRLVSHTPHDPAGVSFRLWEALGRFDGRRTEDILSSLPLDIQEELTTALVRRLVDNHVLIAAD